MNQPTKSILIMTIKINKKQISSICKAIHIDQLKDIKTLVLFVGHAHSGHSIIGSILDAHSQVSLANEVNIVNLIKEHKLSKSEIESILLHYSLNNNKKSAWQNSEYIHRLGNSLQGKTRNPVIIGDKKAGGTTRIIYNNPWVIDYLLNIYNDNIRFVFVKRNPVDIVAAYSYYMQQEPSQFHIDRYLENYQTALTVKKRVEKSQFITINQEEFILRPKFYIQKLFLFLGISADIDLIETWVKNVKSDIPSKSQIIKIPKKYLDQLK